MSEEFEDLSEYMEIHYSDSVCSALTIAIKLKFPEIKELCVGYKTYRREEDEDMLFVSFKSGDYSKEEVEIFINQIKSEYSYYYKNQR